MAHLRAGAASAPADLQFFLTEQSNKGFLTRKKNEREDQQVLRDSEDQNIPGCVLDHPQRKEEYCIFTCLHLIVTSLLTRRLSCGSG